MPTITITGLANYNGQRASVSIETHLGGGGAVAHGGWGWPQPDITVSNGRITLPLRTPGPNNSIWTDRDSYLIIVNFGPPGAAHESIYFYTGGRTLEALGILAWTDVNEKMPRYNFTSATTTIGFNQFQSWFGNPWN
jgi:hypothetical protein